jgi:hypothetical protein
MGAYCMRELLRVERGKWFPLGGYILRVNVAREERMREFHFRGRTIVSMYVDHSRKKVMWN